MGWKTKLPAIFPVNAGNTMNATSILPIFCCMNCFAKLEAIFAPFHRCLLDFISVCSLFSSKSNYFNKIWTSILETLSAKQIFVSKIARLLRCEKTKQMFVSYYKFRIFVNKQNISKTFTSFLPITISWEKKNPKQNSQNSVGLWYWLYFYT